MTLPRAVRITGVLLAAGAGTRMGMPKALRHDAVGQPWLVRGVELLREGGCDRVVVVLGARAPEAAGLLRGDPAVDVVVAADWAVGLSASLRAGLTAASGDAALVSLVDLPALPVSVAHAVLAGGVDTGSLRQAVFHGRPGHPVLIGRAHWPALLDSLSGDRGARPFLVAHGVEEVDCSALSDGADADEPDPGTVDAGRAG